jgi:hypothetical protein
MVVSVVNPTPPSLFSHLIRQSLRLINVLLSNTIEKASRIATLWKYFLLILFIFLVECLCGDCQRSDKTQLKWVQLRYWALSSGRKILSRTGNTVGEQEKRMCPLLAILRISRACFLFFTNDFPSVAYALYFCHADPNTELVGCEQAVIGYQILLPFYSTDPLVLTNTIA